MSALMWWVTYFIWRLTCLICCSSSCAIYVRFKFPNCCWTHEQITIPLCISVAWQYNRCTILIYRPPSKRGAQWWFWVEIDQFGDSSCIQNSLQENLKESYLVIITRDLINNAVSWTWIIRTKWHYLFQFITNVKIENFHFIQHVQGN